MSAPKFFMNAYYFSFEPTGVDEVDAILSAVARAGKAYHHTENWSDSEDGVSQASLIQEAANDAAKAFLAARAKPEGGEK